MNEKRPIENQDQFAIDSFDPQDISWLAFCYVADELDKTSREAFEQRLEQDQSAREAVAIAFAEAQLIDAAIQSPEVTVASKLQPLGTTKAPESNSKSWLRNTLVVVSTVAAIALVAFMMNYFQTPMGASPSNDELAEVWANDDWATEYVSIDVDEVAEDLNEEFSGEFEMTDATWLVAAALEDEELSADPMDLDMPDDGDMPCF